MSDLTDRMRTCVAHLATIEISEVLTDDKMDAIIDARRLMKEAADELEKPIEVRLGPPIEIIKQVPAEPIKQPQVAHYSTPFKPPLVAPEPTATWYDSGVIDQPHQPSRNACPACDSRTTKTVRASGGKIMLECPVCGHMWKR